MDKYEYKLKTEQMLELMEDGAYRKAADIANTIDWRRVRNASMLVQVSDIYEKNKEYQKSYDVLNIAYHRAEGSRKIISRLCTLALKTGNVDEAIDYYDDFVQIAPKDPNQYILRYQILREQRAPIEQQIEALEEFKKSEYIEEWAYELAKLYQEAGMTAECLEECDDLILWFSEGKYVYKAMELKMQYKPLTPSQQEKYDHRFEKPSAETEEMPDLLTYAEEKAGDEDEADVYEAEEAPEEEGADAEEEPEETEQITEEPEETAEEEQPVPEKKKLGDTMRLDEALKKLLHPRKQEAAEEEEEPDMSDLEGAIEEIEAVADLEMADKAVKKSRKRTQVSVSGGMTEIIPEENDSVDEDPAAPEEAAEETAAVPETEPEEIAEIPEESTPVSGDDDQIEGQMSLEDILAGWEQQAEETEPEAGTVYDEDSDQEINIEEIAEEADEFISASGADEILADEPEDLPEDEIFADASEDLPEDEIFADEPEDLPEDEIFADESEDLPEEDEISADEPEKLPEDEIFADEPEDLPEDEIFADESEDLPEEDEIPADETEDLQEKEADISTEQNEIRREKKQSEPILPPDIQRLIDEIEGVIPPEEPEPDRKEKKAEEPHENMGKVTEELRIDDLDDFAEDEEYFAEDEDILDSDGEDFEDEDLPDEEDEDFGDEDLLDEDEEDFGDEDLLDEEDEDFEDEDADDDDGRPDIDEEFRVNPKHSEEPDDREIPDDDDEMDILSATTPLSRKETAKMIATGKTAPLPLNEISDALSMSDTGFIVHGRYDLETQSGIGTRAGLTEEQKKLFSYFVPVRGMSEQLVDVLEQDKNCTNRGGTSKTGNLLIIGNKGNGKTVLAVDVVKAIQKQRNIKQGKVAIVTGDSLNKKKISDIFSKLYGGALIIEKAGKMNEKTTARLNKAMEKDTGELLVVLEEQRKPLDRLLSSNREFRRKFTSRLEVPIFINDELVTFGQTYAQENGYRIDEMGILALYSRIDSLQREDHAVTVAEVKEIMDKAIAHSQKASAKKLVRRVFGKNTDDADRILLSERDFNA